MSYSRWFEAHGRKHAAIMRKLTQCSDDEIIAYFRFENMVENEPDFCPLYAQGKKCHEMEELNCYLCACPHFRFDDEGIRKIEGKVLKSLCAVNAKAGSQSIHEKIIHQNCSSCLLPHRESFIRQCFSRDWFEVMHGVARHSHTRTGSFIGLLDEEIGDESYKEMKKKALSS